MSNLYILIVGLISFAVSFLVTPYLKNLSKRYGVVDKTNSRKIHKGTVARGGGIAIFLGFFTALLFVQNLYPEISGFLIGSLIIVILGIFDDILSLKAFPKLVFQSLAAIIAIKFGVQIDMSMFLRGELVNYSYLSVPLTYLWIVGVTNAMNIIDGLDGLAAGVATISAFTISAVSFTSGRTSVAVLALMLGFASLGFLPHNFRSRIFMGDTGSMFLGYSLAVLAVMGSVKLAAAFSFIIPVLILAVPIFDTLFAIARRLKNRKPIFIGDKEHLHHRLLEMGFSPLQTVMLIYIASIFFGGLAIYTSTVRARTGYIVFASGVALIVLFGFVIVFLHNRIQKKNGKKKT